MGKRLRPLTLEMPKSLIKIGQIPIIIHQLQAMKLNGIDHVIIVLGYKSSMVKDTLSHFEPNYFIKIVENKDYENTNNLYSLYLTFEYLRKEISSHKYEKIVLMNGDVVFDRSILTDMLYIGGNRIAVDVGNYNEESMKVVVDNIKGIKCISKEIPKTEAFGVSIDLYQFDVNTWNNFESIVSTMIEKENLKNAWTEHALQRLFIESRSKFIPLDVKGRYWFEVDTIEDLKEAKRLFNVFHKAKYLIDKKMFLFDLDGTILLGNTVLPYVSEFLNLLLRLNKIIIFITNNSSMSKQEHLKRLRELLHIELQEENLYTSIEDTISFLKSESIHKIFPLATPSIIKEFTDNGFIIDSEQAEAIVVTFDKSLSYEKLEKASLLLENNENIRFILANQDLKCPTEKGFIPDAGSIAKLLETTTGKCIDVFRGKPNSEMITSLIMKNRLSSEDCVFFGDRLYTDITMGDKSGIMTILMLTGETEMYELDLSFLEKYIVLNDFQELLKIINS
jgi:HAD superfamily hydrolase (TIGR01450 family)